jgi:hypothetical protein
MMMANPSSENPFPCGWNELRFQQVIQHYEGQTEEEAVAEDEAAWELAEQSVMVIPTELVETVRDLITNHKAS